MRKVKKSNCEYKYSLHLEYKPTKCTEYIIKKFKKPGKPVVDAFIAGFLATKALLPWYTID